MTTPGLLYVDFVQSAPCSGAIEMWNMCFWIDSNSRKASAITFFVIRHDKERKIYNIVNVNKLNVSLENHTSSELEPVCGRFEVKELILMEEGDYLGFMCHDYLHIALTHAQSGENSTLKVYQSHLYSKYTKDIIDQSTPSLLSDLFESVKDGSIELVPLVQVTLSKY